MILAKDNPITFDGIKEEWKSIERLLQQRGLPKRKAIDAVIEFRIRAQYLERIQGYYLTTN